MRLAQLFWLFLLLIASPFLGVLTHILLMAGSDSSSFAESWIDLKVRSDTSIPDDTIAARFRQPNEKYSGTAALAYYLTRYGDIVYEVDFYRGVQRDLANLAPNRLVQLAAEKGYKLSVENVTYEQLSGKGDLPVIAILRGGIYVVLHQAGPRAIIFDPREGRLVGSDVSLFMKEWLGTVISFRFDAADSGY